MILSRELGKRIWGGSTNMENGGGGVSSDAIAGLLTGYAKESWVGEHYISIDFFSRLFQAHGTENGSEIDVMPNDMETTITSVESMFGFWTNLYISALGSNGAAPAGISLGMLTDVNISGTPTNGQVLTFDAVSGKWVNANAQAGATALANLTDVTLTSLQNGQTLLYDSTTSKWYNSALKTINGQSLLGSGDISVGGGASGNYLPLTGGTLTGDLSIIRDSGYTRLLVRNTSNSTSSFSYIAIGNDLGIGFGSLFVNSSTRAADGGINAFTVRNDNGIFILGHTNQIYNTLIYGTYVGINNGQPTHTLDINGTLHVSGNTDIDGILNVLATTTTTSYNEVASFLAPNIFAGQTSYIQIGKGKTTGQTASLMYKYNGGGTDNILSFGFYGRGEMLSLVENGNVGIGTISPSYKLHVTGTIYATGAITALSDARKKDIMGEADVSVEQIANAPAVQFLWKDKERRKDGKQVGTLAQYWQTVLPEVVSGKGGELSMQYGVAALVSAIVTARKVVDHERRIHELEKENERLKKEVEQLRLN